MGIEAIWRKVPAMDAGLTGIRSVVYSPQLKSTPIYGEFIRCHQFTDFTATFQEDARRCVDPSHTRGHGNPRLGWDQGID